MRFMQTESVLQTKNRSGPAKNRFSVALVRGLSLTKVYGPCQANLEIIAYASGEGSGEPAHPHSLTRTSAARSYKQ